MWRRPVHVAFLFLGLVPCAWAVSIMTADPRRAGVLLVLSFIGMSINGLALLYPRAGLRVPLRIIALGVGLIVLAGVMAMWQWIRTQLLPEAPAAAFDRRNLLHDQMTNLVWIAGATLYVLLSLGIQPVPPRKSVSDKPKRIDFRTYGREKT